MESTPRTIKHLLNDLELRLKDVQTTRIHDELINNFEQLLNECSTHFKTIQTLKDSAFIAFVLPTIFHILISLNRLCSDKFSQDLILRTKTLQNEIKLFFKDEKLYNTLKTSNQKRYFSEQLFALINSSSVSDVPTIFLLHKLIVKFIAEVDDKNQVTYSDTEDSFSYSIYQSILKSLANAPFPTSPNDNKALPVYKMCGCYVQIISRLLRSNKIFNQMEDFDDFISTILKLHSCLESTCDQSRFQIEFFNNFLALQDILQYFLTNSSKIFLDEFFNQLTTHSNKYACLICLIRLIQAYQLQSIEYINQFIVHLFSLIDHCQIPQAISAILPESFGTNQIGYKSVYDITYGCLKKFFEYEPMQTILSSMTKLIQTYQDQTTILSSSNQLACDLVLQSWPSIYQSNSFQYLYGLFLSQLIRLDIHSNLIQRLLNLSNNRSMKYRAYEAFLSSNIIQRFENLFENNLKDCVFNSKNLSTIYPMNIEHLYGFVRIFQSDLSTNQIQHTIDICRFSIQQIFSLTILTEFTCEDLLRILKILNYLPKNSNENLRILLRQLIQIFIELDEKTTNDIRLEFLHVFTNHSNLFDDNDLSCLLDFLIKIPIESNSNSIIFHLVCLHLIESLKYRSNRTNSINDLIVQMLVRYGDEDQTGRLLKVHLMRTFTAYASTGNDEALLSKIRSQCIRLRSSIDEFEKCKQINEQFSTDIIVKILEIRKHDSIRNSNENHLKFYQRIFDELEYQQDNSNAMQQD